MIGDKALTSEERQTKRPTAHEYQIVTANGTIYCDMECLIEVIELNIKVWAVITGDDSPPIVSLGRLCMEKGYTYVWEANHVPVLTKGSFAYECRAVNFVPMIKLGMALPFS